MSIARRVAPPMRWARPRVPGSSTYRFLHENRSEGCTTRALDGAAGSGNLDIVRFLHAHRSEGRTTDAMDGAVGSGQPDIFRFLHENRSEGCTFDAMDYAVETWAMLLDSPSAEDLAEAQKCEDVVSFLLCHRTEGCTAVAITATCTAGSVEMVRDLLGLAMSPAIDCRQALDLAVVMRDVEILQVLNLLTSAHAPYVVVGVIDSYPPADSKSSIGRATHRRST
ncbi:hypothetical protein BDK51DRAFT_49163 [Blyttiomyces helicus]|uniref:Ankyrin repeat-containing domain protein n=1 Tax=Blyttiomyces helicus TaxID=388810 RepID=A0A4P9WCG1_9FUNG|nr:hypothetical protein BDK51DRAFT_49163 [Blyttiomyces helicus]|eukprot:RKO89335.1 hypothetical protein BDK51DRAFT_49163 [Blyttiomyces helicus]